MVATEDAALGLGSLLSEGASPGQFSFAMLGADATDVQVLATGTDGVEQATGIGGKEEEKGLGRRFLEAFQKGIGSLRVEAVGSREDGDFPGTLGGSSVDKVTQYARGAVGAADDLAQADLAELGIRVFPV